MAFAELIDIEGKLGLDVRMRALRVIDDGTVLLFKIRKFDGDCVIDGVTVSYGVAYVVRQRPDSEGEIVGVLGVAEEATNKVAGADVVGEVGEEGVAEGIVTEVLNGTAAVGISASLLELGFGEIGVAFEQDGTDGMLPRDIDDGFVGLYRVRDAGRGCQDEDEQRQDFKKRRL